ncbi:MAG TPA: hypothetical protein PK361_04360 [Chiayiivirga sp.]|nr:hypothetical protein [Chiayiivirga sp.]
MALLLPVSRKYQPAGSSDDVVLCADASVSKSSDAPAPGPASDTAPLPACCAIAASGNAIAITASRPRKYLAFIPLPRYPIKDRGRDPVLPAHGRPCPENSWPADDRA